MVASTFMSGLHDVIDVIASIPLFAASLALYTWWGHGLYASSTSLSTAPGERVNKSAIKKQTTKNTKNTKQIL